MQNNYSIDKIGFYKNNASLSNKREDIFDFSYIKSLYLIVKLILLTII